MSEFGEKKVDPAVASPAIASAAVEELSAQTQNISIAESSTEPPSSNSTGKVVGSAPAPPTTTTTTTTATTTAVANSNPPPSSAPAAPSAAPVGSVPAAPVTTAAAAAVHPTLKEVKHRSLAARQTDHLKAGINFDDPSLKIPKPILDALILDLRFERPSQIQAVTIPRIMKGRNIIAQAQTGSGKTVAFVIGMLACVDPSQPTVQALCLTPTRELASQIVSDAVVPLSKYLPNIRHELIVPDEVGAPSTRAGVCTAHVVVGTPGTVQTLIRRRYLKDLKRTVKLFVCDEADEMVDQRELGQATIGIKNDLSPTCQTLLFSATYTEEVLNYARHVASNACVVKLKTNDALVLKSIFQVRINVSTRHGGVNKKLEVLRDIYGYFGIEQSIIFVNSRDAAEAVARMFANESYSVSFLHGRLGPAQRDEEMRKFRDGETIVLVTTNVLSRGVDVPAVDVIVNYDLPTKPGMDRKADALTYLHRIGRCGRFGRPGTAITLLENPWDESMMAGVEQFYGHSQQDPMTTPWDPNQIDTLADEVRRRATLGTESVHLDVVVEVDERPH